MGRTYVANFFIFELKLLSQSLLCSASVSWWLRAFDAVLLRNNQS